MAPEISLDNRNAWDDSALIDSWEEALQEYKKYHSIQAQGKRLEDVLSEKELRELREEHGDLLEDIQTVAEVAESNSHADANDAEALEHNTNNDSQTSQSLNQAKGQTNSGNQDQTRVAETPLPPPNAILGTVQNDNLKNLMMSWYYAGYYTGLHAAGNNPFPSLSLPVAPEEPELPNKVQVDSSTDR